VLVPQLREQLVPEERALLVQLLVLVEAEELVGLPRGQLPEGAPGEVPAGGGQARGVLRAEQEVQQQAAGAGVQGQRRQQAQGRREQALGQRLQAGEGQAQSRAALRRRGVHERGEAHQVRVAVLRLLHPDVALLALLNLLQSGLVVVQLHLQREQLHLNAPLLSLLLLLRGTLARLHPKLTRPLKEQLFVLEVLSEVSFLEVFQNEPVVREELYFCSRNINFLTTQFRQTP